MLITIRVVFLALLSTTTFAGDASQGWTTFSPREEIRPKFSYEATGGPKHDGSLIIESSAQEGQQGRWTKSFPVLGGRYYHFVSFRRMTGVESPRRFGVARILWRDALNKRVQHAEPTTAPYAAGATV